MSFSLSFVVAIASNVLVPIRSPLPLPLPLPPIHPLQLLLLSSYFVAPKFAATSNGKCSSKSRSGNACLPDCLPVCVCCVCACWHAADTVTFTVLPNVFVACLFVRPAVCPLSPPLSVRPSFVVLSVPFRALSFLLSAYCRRLLSASHFVCLATINV